MATTHGPRDGRDQGADGPLLGQLGGDAEPAEGVTEVAAGHQDADVGARAGEDQPVDGLVGRSRRRWTCTTRQVAHAVAPRMAATKNRARGWAQVTTGAAVICRSA